MAKEIGQAFGGIGDAVSGVLKGVGDAVNGAVKGVGDIAKSIYESPIGRALIIAGAVYFGGAALAGGFGTVGTSTSFLSGMGTGVAEAAGSLSSAWGLAAEGNFGSAASTLGNSWGSAYRAGAGISDVAANTVGNVAAAQGAQIIPEAGVAGPTPMAGGYGSGMNAGAAAAPPPPIPSVAAGLPDAQLAVNSAGISQQGALNSLAAPGGVPPVGGTPPWYSQALDYLTPKSDLAKYGLISGATQVAGHVISGIGQEQAAREQREYEAEQLRKAQEMRNANVGADLFAPGQYAPAPGPAPAPAGLARRYMPQPAAGYVPGSRFAQMYGQLPPGYGAAQSVMGG
jgi:hypothetical protein